MTSFSETPIFPATIAARPQGTVGSGSNTTLALATGGTYGLVIEGPIVCMLNAGVARTFDIKLNNGATTTTIGRVVTGSVAHVPINILNSTYIPGFNDYDPRLVLGPSEVLQIVPADSGAAAMEFTCLGASTFQYPNG